MTGPSVSLSDFARAGLDRKIRSAAFPNAAAIAAKTPTATSPDAISPARVKKSRWLQRFVALAASARTNSARARSFPIEALVRRIAISFFLERSCRNILSSAALRPIRKTPVTRCRDSRLAAFSLLSLIAASAFAANDSVAPALSSKSSEGVYTPKANVQTTPMRVVVLDGATFRDIETGRAYRLYGVDACATDQSATLGRQPWPCGAVAIAWLVGATLGKWTACNVVSEADGVTYARCATSEHPDIALDMLKEGQAVTYPDGEGKTLHAYVEAEAEARKSFRGLWASQFQFPWDFRKAHRLVSPPPQ